MFVGEDMKEREKLTLVHNTRVEFDRDGVADDLAEESRRVPALVGRHWGTVLHGERDD